MIIQHLVYKKYKENVINNDSKEKEITPHNKINDTPDSDLVILE